MIFYGPGIFENLEATVESGIHGPPDPETDFHNFVGSGRTRDFPISVGPSPGRSYVHFTKIFGPCPFC